MKAKVRKWMLEYHEFEHDETHTVDPEYRCPCGENRLDWLVWIGGNTVRCGACGKVYTVEE